MSDSQWSNGFSEAIQGLAFSIDFIKSIINGILNVLNDFPLLTLFLGICVFATVVYFSISFFSNFTNSFDYELEGFTNRSIREQRSLEKQAEREYKNELRYQQRKKEAEDRYLKRKMEREFEYERRKVEKQIEKENIKKQKMEDERKKALSFYDDEGNFRVLSYKEVRKLQQDNPKRFSIYQDMLKKYSSSNDS